MRYFSMVLPQKSTHFSVQLHNVPCFVSLFFEMLGSSLLSLTCIISRDIARYSIIIDMGLSWQETNPFDSLFCCYFERLHLSVSFKSHVVRDIEYLSQ